MALTIGAFSTNALLAQPFGYEGEARQGLTARKWLVRGLLTSAQWVSLCSVYDTWRDTRITDADTADSGVVGTTVLFTGTGFGQTWTNVPCWFASPPSAEQTGAYVDASVELVDAAQALQVLLREKEKAEQSRDLPNLGTFTLGGCTITLTSPPESYTDLPALALTANGSHYLSGPFTATRIRNIEGYTTASGWAALQTWCEASWAATPSVGDYYPTSAPTATAENIIEGGVKVVRYTVNITVAVVR